MPPSITLIPVTLKKNHFFRIFFRAWFFLAQAASLKVLQRAFVYSTHLVTRYHVGPPANSISKHPLKNIAGFTFTTVFANFRQSLSKFRRLWRLVWSFESFFFEYFHKARRVYAFFFFFLSKYPVFFLYKHFSYEIPILRKLRQLKELGLKKNETF